MSVSHSSQCYSNHHAWRLPSHFCQIKHCAPYSLQSKDVIVVVIGFANTHMQLLLFPLRVLFKIIGYLLHLIFNNNNMRGPIKMQPRGEEIKRICEHRLDYVAAQIARSDDASERCLCFSFRGRAWHTPAPDFETFYLQTNKLAKVRISRVKNKVMDSQMETMEQGKLMTVCYHLNVSNMSDRFETFIRLRLNLFFCSTILYVS